MAKTSVMVAKSFKLYLYHELTVPQVSDCCPLGRLVSFLMCTKIINYMNLLFILYDRLGHLLNY